jgi:hypothetical protein
MLVSSPAQELKVQLLHSPGKLLLRASLGIGFAVCRMNFSTPSGLCVTVDF